MGLIDTIILVIVTFAPQNKKKLIHLTFYFYENNIE